MTTTRALRRPAERPTRPATCPARPSSISTRTRLARVLGRGGGRRPIPRASSGPCAGQYRGEWEPKYTRAGHIPGARNAHWKGNLRKDGTFATPEVLRRRYGDLGVRKGVDVVVYCGSGISACHDLVALELAGLPGARLYPGSWSDWSARPDAPVETGDGRA